MGLTDDAISKIKDMIISGRVNPGEKLPREADLASELGLSRSSLREAVRALTLVNVLDVRQGDGTYATSLAPSLLLEVLSFIVDFHRDDTILDVLEVRGMLEPAATALAAARMPEDDCLALGKLLSTVDMDTPIDELVAMDLEFHRQIALGAGNPFLASLVDNISTPTTRARVWARNDRAECSGAHVGRASGDLQRDRRARHRNGQVVGDRPHRRNRVLAPDRSGRTTFRVADQV